MPDTRFIIVIVNYKKTGKNHGIPDKREIIIEGTPLKYIEIYTGILR